MEAGVFVTMKKNGEKLYRASVTCRGKHISLGSFSSEKDGAKAYRLARLILFNERKESEVIREGGQPEGELWDIDDYELYGQAVSFDKWVMLLNLKNSGMYCRNPIYLQNRYFLYYVDRNTALKFDVEDLFYYMNHKIMKRGGHLFVADYGMQISILSRYGIKSFAVKGRDYEFVNGDTRDYRYENIHVINKYYGVTSGTVRGKRIYTAKIHIRSNYIIGRYETEQQAAAAYNKAVALLREQGIDRGYQENYIDELNEIEYAKLYNRVQVSDTIRNITEVLQKPNKRKVEK